MAIEIVDYVQKAESGKHPNANGFASVAGSPESSQFVTGDTFTIDFNQSKSVYRYEIGEGRFAEYIYVKVWNENSKSESIKRFFPAFLWRKRREVKRDERGTLVDVGIKKSFGTFASWYCSYSADQNKTMSVLSEAQLQIRVDSVDEFDTVDYNDSNATRRAQVWEFNFVDSDTDVVDKIKAAEETLFPNDKND